MPNTIISGSGCYIPERVVGASYFLNSEFFDDNSQRLDKTNEEIIAKFVEITEIAERRYAAEDMKNSEMAAIAAEKAIQDANIERNELDYIIAATNFGEVDEFGNSNFMPSFSALVKHRLGITNTKTRPYDMIFGCPGWLEGLILADDLIKSRRAKKILVVGSEKLHNQTDPYDRNKMIFADGAGAVVASASDDERGGILAANTRSYTAEELDFLVNSSSLNPEADKKRLYIRMRGRKIYEFALKNVPDLIKETIEDAGLGINDISKILIHQANAKMDYAMVDRVYKLFGIKNGDHGIAPMTIQQFGNSSTATIPTMFDLIKRGEMEGHTFEPGANIVMASVGAGMNINAAVYRFS